MAKLSAHGHELGTFHYLRFDKRFMSDGHVLINFGDGWKLKSKVKAGIDVPTAFKSTVDAYNNKLTACPTYKDFLKLLLDNTNLKERARVVIAFELLGNDIDGIWATLDDEGISIDLETLQEMSAYFDAGMKEMAAYKKSSAGKIS